MKRHRHGFTLIELIIFMAIFTLIAVAFLGVFVAITNVQTRQNSQAEVIQQGQFLLQQIQYYIQNARVVSLPLDTPTGTLMLRMFSTAQDPTIISVSSNTAYLYQGNSGAEQLTSSRDAVSSLTFTRHYNISSSSAGGADSVSFSFVISENTSSTKQAYSQSFQSSAVVVTPVPKITLVQQAKVETSTASVGSLSATFAYNNQTSSLLLAVVANTTSSASVSIADSASNTWTEVANPIYSAYNEAITVFAAPNAKNALDTVTTTFGAGAGVASLFIYEYRGAATASSFDASSTSLQPSTQTPSSGLAYPTSTVELLFGVTYNGNTSEIPSAGKGFTLETTSTIAHVFVEDETAYITSPVTASWQYSGTTPSSSALIATFK